MVMLNFARMARIIPDDDGLEALQSEGRVSITINTRTKLKIIKH